MWADPDRQAGQHCWEKPQSIPQRNSGPTTADGSVEGPWLCWLFICPSSLLKNKQLIWQQSGRMGRRGDPRPPLPPPATTADSLAGYITFTKSFLFSSLLWLMALFSIFPPPEEGGILRACSALWLTFSLKAFILQSYTILRRGLRLINKLRGSVTHFWASCHLTGNKGPHSRLIFLIL